jgi:hypothetical protein
MMLLLPAGERSTSESVAKTLEREQNGLNFGYIPWSVFERGGIRFA